MKVSRLGLVIGAVAIGMFLIGLAQKAYSEDVNQTVNQTVNTSIPIRQGLIKDIRQDRREIRQDNREIRYDRRDLRKAIQSGDEAKIEEERKELRQDVKERKSDAQDLGRNIKDRRYDTRRFRRRERLNETR
jgi:uncharacterized protein (UPF0335 family)